MTSKRVLSVMRNSYNSWWKCLHTCDKLPKLVTIKVLAETVHLQDFISVQNNLLHTQWNNGSGAA